MHYYHSWQGDPIPPEDGFLHIELSRKPVPYHFARCFEGEIDSRTCQALALSSCRISCMVTDVVRGRIASHKLQRTVAGPCLRKLDTMSAILTRESRERAFLGHPMGILPVIPQSIRGMLISPSRVETMAHLTIGRTHHWVNLVLQQNGSRWMCVLADVG
ncbi:MULTISPECIES: hypothetical protein [Bifidobacterium]|uniref:hypothetical protein n=1 Tax=Bifidobacterium TaxID=1678 RepID=UPI001BDCC29A|nr:MULTISPECIES: hypothetical protein [Bifidobacterium]MBT1161607.1 hypothetical protein [Bifidobacterium sp. SO1]MBW3078779.1 hypothetical protein [Bifidobacterium simiiventris]